MEVRFESMLFLWDDKIPTMFLEFMNLLTLCQSEEQLRASVKDFAEKHELGQTHIRRMSSRTGQVANGKGKEGGQAMNEAGYQTLIVKFSEPITVLDGMFDDAEAWGVDTLKGWIDNYESSRFTAIDSHTAVITSEYNMECLKEWLERCTPITEKTEF